VKVVFIDPKCPSPYDSATLASRGLGGTEATVVRVARALASRHHDVRVLQHNRTVVQQEGERLVFLPGASATDEVKDADHMVFIQKAQAIGELAARGNARLWLWLHNFLGDEVPYFWQDHLRYPLGVICVSRTHAEHTRRHIRRLGIHWLSGGALTRGGLTYIHNPIDDDLAIVPTTGQDRRKLVFFSSPYKGIEHVVTAFRYVYERDPAFRLVVADPGYIRNFDPAMLDHPGISRVGSLAHQAVIEHVRESLCVFYPQYKRPETFGLVFAEANAVGVPVLAHDFGSAREVLDDTNPPIDARNLDDVFSLLSQWQLCGTPAVRRRSEFALTSVVKQWDSFLTNPQAFMRERCRFDQAPVGASA
jgi:glycosyltransferase involved in cell wall biosynthesis